MIDVLIALFAFLTILSPAALLSGRSRMREVERELMREKELWRNQ